MTKSREIEPPLVGAVVIGRNEGDRLIRCLASVSETNPVIYVDSGSTDGSVEAAQKAGAEVVLLDRELPFTAARARNAGLAALMATAERQYVQFIDGDCELQPGWITAAATSLNTYPSRAAVFGRLRERFPDASLYNQLCDWEWDGPTGKSKACGGNAMMRVAALRETGGFNSIMIAGEEPELCVRLRARGWEIWRLENEMALHDAALTRFSQWWKRTKRGGYAFAQGAEMHGAPPERHCISALRRITFWGIVLPLMTIVGVFLTPWALLLLLAWPAQILRLRFRGEPWRRALFLTLSKLPEALGAITYLRRRVTHAPTHLIEYK